MRCRSSRAGSHTERRPRCRRPFPRLMLAARGAAPPAAGPAREGIRHLADARPGRELAHAGARSWPAAWPRPGLQRGDHLVVVGDNRPRLYATMLAAQALGAVPVPLYQDAVAAEFVFPINNAEVALRDRRGPGAGRQAARDARAVPAARAHLVRRPARPAQLRRAGPGVARRADRGRHGLRRSAPGLLRRRGRQPASPTTWRRCSSPRAPPATPRAWCTRTSRCSTAPAPAPTSTSSPHDEEVLAYLPPAWIGQNIFSYAQWLACGYVVNCPESAATVTIDLKEIGPTYYFAPPRVFEGLLTSVMIRMEDAGAIKRWLFHALHGAGPARRPGAHGRQAGRGRSTGCSTRWATCWSTARCATRWAFRACAWPTPRARRSGPTCSASTARSASTSSSSTARPRPRCSSACSPTTRRVPTPWACRSTASRSSSPTAARSWSRSPGLLKEYYKNPAATAEVLDADGWYHTGDAGFIDAGGHLKIIDRAKDVGRIVGGPNDGAMFAPKYVENKLKFFPFVKEAVAFGDRREKVCAFVNIDFDAVGNWAERRNLPYAGYTDLAGKPEVLELIRDCVEKVNADLAAGQAAGRQPDHAASWSCTRSSTPTTASSRARARSVAAASPRSTACSSMRSTPAGPSSTSRPRCSSRTGAAAASRRRSGSSTPGPSTP